MIDWTGVSEAIAQRISVKTKRTGAPSLEEVAAGLTACYENAELLLKDVRLLTSAHRNARAAALTILALEELGKIPDLHGTAVRTEISKSDLFWPAFWKRYYSHRSKQEVIAIYGAGIPKSGEAASSFNRLPYASFLPSDIAVNLDQLKQMCLYTDHDASGFRAPEEVIAGGEMILDALFLVAEERLDSFARMHITARRSRVTLDRSIERERRVVEDKPLSITEQNDDNLGAFKGLWEPMEVEADLMSAMSHRSSGTSDRGLTIPDYFGFSALCDGMQDGLAPELCLDAFRAACRRVRQRLENPTLGLSAARAFLMLKLVFSHLERRGETAAGEIAFGRKV